MDLPDYSTPEALEETFYRAFEQADIELMVGLWATDDTICCIHPMGRVLHGPRQVRQGWEELFAGGQRMHFQIQSRPCSRTEMLAIHSVIETIFLHGDPRPRPSLLATNAYKLTEHGWRMVLHHASPSVLDSRGPQRPPENPPPLH